MKKFGSLLNMKTYQSFDLAMGKWAMSYVSVLKCLKGLKIFLRMTSPFKLCYK